MDTERILQIVLKARDDASAVVEKAGKNMGGVADAMSKSFNNAAIVSGAALAGLTVEVVRSIGAFEESQKVMAQTEAVLKSTAASRVGVHTQIQVGTKQISNTTAEYSEKVKDAEAKLHDMEKRMKSVKEPTESAKLALEKQRMEVEKLHGEAIKTVGVFKDKFNPAMQITAEQVAKTAQELMRLSGVSDETIQSAENMLLTFTSIGKDVLPNATRTVLDMSVALGQDTKNSAIQLGKALQEPITGITALRRVGVAFTDSQQEQIKKLVESNHLMDAQKIILKELNTEFGGSAEAAGKTFAGKLNILKETFNNLEETMGGFLIKGLEPLIDKFQKVANAITDVVEGDKKLSDLTKTLRDNFGSVGETLGKTIEFFAKNKDATVALAGVIGGVLTISLLGATLAIGAFIGVSLPMLGIFGLLGGAIALAITHFDDIKKAAANVQAAFEYLKKDGIDAVKKAYEEVQKKIKEVGDFFKQHEGVIKGVAGTITAFFLPALIKTGVEATIAGAKLGASLVSEIIATGSYAVMSGAQMAFNFVVSIIQVGVESVVAGAKLTAGVIASTIKYGIEGWKTIAMMTAKAIQFGITTAAFVAHTAATIAGTVATTAMSAATWVLNAALIVLTSPITLVVLAIGAVIAIGYLLVTHWKEVETVGKKVFKALGDVFLEVGAIIQGVIENIIGGVKKMINYVIDGINSMIRGINDVSGKVPGVGGAIKIPELPKFENGGYVPKTGLAIVHQGEFVMSKAMLAGKQGVPASVSNTHNQPVYIYATVNNSVDLNELGYRVSQAIRNSR